MQSLSDKKANVDLINRNPASLRLGWFTPNTRRLPALRFSESVETHSLAGRHNNIMSWSTPFGTHNPFGHPNRCCSSYKLTKFTMAPISTANSSPTPWPIDKAFGQSPTMPLLLDLVCRQYPCELNWDRQSYF
jgi:hypothetical protein